MNQNEIPLLLSFAGNFIMGAGFIFTYFRKGGNTASSDVIKIFQLRDEEQKKVIEELREEVKKNGLALANLQGQNSEKDKKIQEYLEIFRGRSPEQEQYMNDMRDFTAGVAKYMKDSADIFSSMKIFMTQLNANSQSNLATNLAIDKKLKGV